MSFKISAKKDNPEENKVDILDFTNIKLYFVKKKRKNKKINYLQPF